MMVMSTQTSSSPDASADPEHPSKPGWYVHPTDSSWDMYWDGTRWSRSRAHRAPATPTPGRVTALYLGACILPFTAAILVPWPLFMAVSPDGGVGTADAWADAGAVAVLAGWTLWALGWLGWMLGASMFKDERAQAPDALDRWHRTGRGWAIGVAVWGVIATTAFGMVLMLGMALGGVSNGL
jgi:hypothetical protein